MSHFPFTLQFWKTFCWSTTQSLVFEKTFVKANNNVIMLRPINNAASYLHPVQILKISI